MLLKLSDLPEHGASVDMVVVGAGGAGLAAALCGALGGAKVLLVERTGLVGGTTALSAGTAWVPGSDHAASVNADDSLAQAHRYLDAVVADHAPKALRESLLSHGAQALRHLEAHSHVAWRPYALHPDYESDQPGATARGRALEPLPFDGRRLGALFAVLRPPIPEFTVLGGMMVDRGDIQHLLNMRRSWTSLRHGLQLLARHACDRLRYPRGTRLVMGNALVARLLFSLSQHRQVSLLLHTELLDLHREGQTITGLRLQQQGQVRTVTVRGGVVLASGGFNRHPAWRVLHLPGAMPDTCPGAPGHTGAAQAAALAVGGHHAGGHGSTVFWAPVSTRLREDGSTAVFPHFVMDRAKPGVMAVSPTGQRFVNESTSYHRFGAAMRAQQLSHAWLLADALALKRWGLGLIRPGGHGLAPLLAQGYVKQAESMEALAAQIEVDPATLQATVARFNAQAEQGTDPDFQRGETLYQRNIGAPGVEGAKACLGPLTQAPFYAVKVHAGDIGAALGLETDAQARVLDGKGQVLLGLYAVGNDMQSPMGGTYPGPGITIGPGQVFAYLAAQDLLQRLSHTTHTP